jgi:hypothetical protein
VDCGLRWVWVRGGLPFGGDCHLLDDHGRVVALLDRDSFIEDPDGFMDTLARHLSHNRVLGLHLSVAV